MAADVHLKLGSLKGEATHEKHKGEIEVLSWSWGVSNPTSIQSGGGAGKGKAVAGSLSIVKNYDSSSPGITKACAAGEHFPEATLTCRKAGGEQQEFLTIKLKEIYVESYQTSQGGGGDVTDSISLVFAEIKTEYKTQDDKGATGGAVKFGWDIKQAKVDK